MSAPCPLLPADTGIAASLNGAIDCFVHGSGSENYARFVGAGSPFGIVLTTAMTLYVALIGYRLIFGAGGIALSDWAPRALLLGAIMALTTSWNSYQLLVYDVLTQGPQQIAAWSNAQAGQPGNLMARVDTISGHMLDIADAWSRSTDADVAEQAAQPGDIFASANSTDTQGESSKPLAAKAKTAVSPITIITPRGGLGPNMLLLGALLLLLASAGVVAVAKVLLALLLMIGPMFVALALFDSTRGLAVGWARAAVSLAIVPLFALLTTAAALAFLEPLVLAMAVGAPNGEFSLRTATGILVAVVVMAAVCVQLFRLSRVMTAAWVFLPAQRARAATMAEAPPAPLPAVISPGHSAERIFTLVADVERHGGASATGISHRSLALIAPAHTPFVAAAATAQTTPNARRTMDGGRIRPLRAPLRMVRGGQ
ncbi:MAG: type IV secretion system protein [Sphingomonas sp.]|jgi:type IV secretion system protein VirB6